MKLLLAVIGMLLVCTALANPVPEESIDLETVPLNGDKVSYYLDLTS